MDSILNAISGALGVDSTTLVLLLGVVVAVCNLVAKLIPDDALGYLSVVRRICKVLGLYISNRVVGQVTSADATRVVAGVTPKSAVTGSSTTAKSPTIVGIVAILVGIATVLLSGCAPATVAGINTAANAVCTSAPIAQALYNSAVATGDQDKVNEVLNKLQAICPSVVLLIHTVPVRVEVPVPAPPVPGPERG